MAIEVWDDDDRDTVGMIGGDGDGGHDWRRWTAWTIAEHMRNPATMKCVCGAVGHEEKDGPSLSVGSTRRRREVEEDRWR